MGPRTLTAAGAAAASLVLTATPALAGTPYDTTVGGSSTGTHAVTASSTVASVFIFGTQTVTCQTSTVSGEVFAGSNASQIGRITSISWDDCEQFGVIGWPVTIANPVNWPINATGGDTAGTTDTVTGRVTSVTGSSIQAHFDTDYGCAFDVIGTNAGDSRFFEATQTLQVLGTNGNLQVKNVNSSFLCLGLVSNNQSASFAGTYAINSPDGPILIS